MRQHRLIDQCWHMQLVGSSGLGKVTSLIHHRSVDVLASLGISRPKVAASDGLCGLWLDADLGSHSQWAGYDLHWPYLWGILLLCTLSARHSSHSGLWMLILAGS